MNTGRAMQVDTPAAIRALMKESIIEIVCDRVRDGMRVLEDVPGVASVQAFGDRLHVVMPVHDIPLLRSRLGEAGLTVESARAVAPTLEDVFINLVTHDQTHEVQA